MSTERTLLLGAIAGITIFLGLPLGRIRNANPAVKAAFSAVATGVLIFLLIEVADHGFAPVEEGAEEHEWGDVVGYGLVFAGGLIVGLMGLVFYDRWMFRQRGRTLV